MIKLIKGIKDLLNFVRTAFDILMSIFKTIAMCFEYIFSTIQVAFQTISNFPVWITSFMIITIAISVTYFIIGRSAGKSD